MSAFYHPLGRSLHAVTVHTCSCRVRQPQSPLCRYYSQRHAARSHNAAAMTATTTGTAASRHDPHMESTHGITMHVAQAHPLPIATGPHHARTTTLTTCTCTHTRPLHTAPISGDVEIACHLKHRSAVEVLGDRISCSSGAASLAAPLLHMRPEGGTPVGRVDIEADGEASRASLTLAGRAWRLR